jgi:hypothetical protein
MKINKFFLITLLFISTEISFGASIILEPLKPGQCVADPETKTYLNDPTTSSPVQFSCHYKCLNQANKTFLVPVKHEEYVLASADQMNVLICDQIRIEVKKSELGYVLDQTVYASAFYAQTSPRPELIKWAHDNNGLIPQDHKIELRQNMNKIFLEISRTSMPRPTSSNPTMFQFASDLYEIGIESEVGQIKLNYYLDLLKKSNEPQSMAEKLVLTMIKTHGSFLL